MWYLICFMGLAGAVGLVLGYMIGLKCGRLEGMEVGLSFAKRTLVPNLKHWAPADGITNVPPAPPCPPRR